MSMCSILLMDDDHDYAYRFRLALTQYNSGIAVIHSARPVLQCDYDVYVISAEISGLKCGAEMAYKARMIHPDAMIILLASDAEISCLSNLLAGQNILLATKQDCLSQPQLLRLISAHAAIRQRGYHDHPGRSRSRRYNVVPLTNYRP